MLERTHLAIIRAVEQHGSMTAAAETLHLTQSALSHTMRKLEDQLGVAIWHREGRRLRLTQAGDLLLKLAERLLPQLERAEDHLRQIARGERGALRIGMECHLCYEWLRRIVSPYLAAWPAVDVDVKQQFQFGGIAALFAHEIDLLVTPDPLYKPSLVFEPVFEYEQVLVVGASDRLSRGDQVEPSQLADRVLFTYPVETDRLDIFNLFLRPAGISPKRHKTIENTDIMLQMVANQRGVAALPRWIVEEYSQKLDLTALRLGKQGVTKQIFLGVREADAATDYVRAFIAQARRHRHTHTE